jgi:hypothetical protein
MRTTLHGAVPRRAAEQGDEADGAFGGMVAGANMPPHARAGGDGRGHRSAAYPQCWADTRRGSRERRSSIDWSVRPIRGSHELPAESGRRPLHPRR